MLEFAHRSWILYVDFADFHHVSFTKGSNLCYFVNRLQNSLNATVLLLETLRFQDEDDYADEIFQYQSSARASTSVISAGKRDSRRHSTARFSENVVVAKTSYRKVRSFIILRSGEGLTSFNKK